MNGQAMKVEHVMTCSTEGMMSIVRVTSSLDKLTSSEMVMAMVREVARLVAEKYVAEHYQEIVKHIDQNAIATLSVAEASAKIRESLEKNIPGRVEHIVEKQVEVYQRGLLGGITRIR